MRALQKPDGGIQGIATGTVFRHLVAKTLTRQFGTAVETACAPFQFALSTREEVDCVGYTVRAATEENPRLTVLSVDGIGASDHVLRAAMLSKLRQIPFCRLCDKLTLRHHHTLGKMRKDRGTALVSMRVGNRATLLFSLAIHDVGGGAS